MVFVRVPGLQDLCVLSQHEVLRATWPLWLPPCGMQELPYHPALFVKFRS